MKYLMSFLMFWRDFIIGDDWTIAAGAGVTLGLVAVIARTAIVPWLWLPFGVALVLAGSLRRA
jgi:hypothetical protein